MSPTPPKTPQPLLVASQYNAAGSSTRVRIYDWLTHLGIEDAEEFEYRGTSSNSPGALLRDIGGTLRAERARLHLPERAAGRTVMLSRELTPLSQGGTEAALLRGAALGVYDFDDALYAALPGAIGKIYSRRRVWQKSVRAADTVIAGSDILAEAAASLHPNVVMVPSCVEHTEYAVKSNFSSGPSPLAVWIGSPATEPYLQIAQAGLLRAHQETGLRLKVISAGAHPLGELDKMVDRVSWSAEGFAGELAHADFGIMPLPDNEWARGKCAYKLLQYGAAGLPVIGSAVGANQDAIAKLHGVPVHSPERWGEALIDLVRADSASLRAMGSGARTGVIEHYSFAAWRDTWQRTVLTAS